MSPETPHTRALYRRMQGPTLVALLVLQALLALSVRAEPGRLPALLTAFALVGLGNVVLLHRALARWGVAARQLFNLLAIALYGHLSGWALPVWIFLPVHSFWMAREPAPGVRLRLGVMLACVTGLALLDGASAPEALGFLLLSVLAYAITETRVAITRAAVDALSQQHAELSRAHAELASAHAQLDQAHTRAREQERLSSLGLLAAGIAHEINNPLAFVKSNVHSLSYDLQAQQGLSADLQEYVDDVLPATLDGIQRIVSIVSDLRRFARVDAEQMVEYDLNEEARAALRISRSQLQGRCEVEVQLGELPRMTGWPRQISQVLVNLLVNAAQAMPTRGKVTLSTRVEAGHALIRVADTGMGMSPEVQARLFEPFVTTTPVGEGTGMGLAVVHGIVTAHGGSIGVHSVQGEGTTFTLRLPCELPAAVTSGGAGAEPPAAPPQALRMVARSRL